MTLRSSCSISVWTWIRWKVPILALSSSDGWPHRQIIPLSVCNFEDINRELSTPFGASHEENPWACPHSPSEQTAANRRQGRRYCPLLWSRRRKESVPFVWECCWRIGRVVAIETVGYRTFLIYCIIWIWRFGTFSINARTIPQLHP